MGVRNSAQMPGLKPLREIFENFFGKDPTLAVDAASAKVDAHEKWNDVRALRQSFIDETSMMGGDTAKLFALAMAELKKKSNRGKRIRANDILLRASEFARAKAARVIL